MRAYDRTGLAVGVAVVLASWTLSPLSVDRSFLVLGALGVGFLVVTGVGLRRVGLGEGTVFASELLGLSLYSLGLSLTLPGESDNVLEHYPLLWAAGVEHMQTQASPMAPDAGVTLIFVTVIGMITVLTDLLVNGISRPAWAIAPPATLFLVPALGLGTDTGLGNFVLVATGYLGILVADGLNRASRWTRGLTRDSAAATREATPVVWRAAGYVAGPAVVAAAVLGVALPTLVIPGFGLGSGAGGNGPLQLTDPTLDIQRNLTQPQDRVVLEYQTDAPGGVYLRLASLPQLSANGWGNVPIRLESGERLPPIPGSADEPDTRRTTHIQVLDFGSQYLPMPYAPRSFSAPGTWLHDPRSLVVVNENERPGGLRNLEYTVESVDIAPEPADLATAPVGDPADAEVTAVVPDDMPDRLVTFARELTADADTPAAKAAAIQQHLRSGEFSYNVERLPGSGYRALENFLFVDRRGYCEQFAAAMAALARAVGIPTRVSVGFLPGERDGDRYEVSIRDMHAWPELYFEGFGWVRFEPTPSNVTGSAPDWTLPEASPAAPSASASSSASASDEASASSEPTALPTEDPTAPTTSTNASWWRPVLVGLAALLGMALLAAPASIRVRRRRSRLSETSQPEERVESAWAEIRDTVVDYGGTWPSGSPRAIGNQVGGQLDSAESDAMGQVATLVERSRYAESLGDPDATNALPAITQGIRRGIAAPASPLRRLLAVIAPRSLFRRR